jgi:hypothetical protein
MDGSFGQRDARKLTQASTTRKAFGIAFLIVLAIGIGACAIYLRAHRRVDTFAASPAEGWHIHGPVERYAAGDMYLKIDGAADTYLRFNAECLRFATYARDAASATVVEVYCYDMASAADAREAYESERPPDAVAVSAGDTAYRTGGTVFFLRGESYVQLIPMHCDDADAPAILALARALAR